MFTGALCKQDSVFKLVWEVLAYTHVQRPMSQDLSEPCLCFRTYHNLAHADIDHESLREGEGQYLLPCFPKIRDGGAIFFDEHLT